MQTIIDFLMRPWPWWFSGAVISLVMFSMIFFGKSFGFSSNLRTLCSVAGAGKKVAFFDFNWKSQIWNLVFLAGAIIGGFIAKQFLSYDEPFILAESTRNDLLAFGFGNPESVQPAELFSWTAATSIHGFLVLAFGGFMVGFGSRYAGGCTSGHAISGISNLQVPSLIAVIGFFIGGLVMTHLLFTLIF